MSDITRICELLDKRYGEKHWSKPTPVIDELIFTILSQNTTAQNCEVAFSRLRKRFPKWADVLNADVEEIEEAIKPAGLANVRAPRIKKILEQINERHGQLNLEWISELSDEDAMRYLQEFEGVGVKTAACVLMFALGRPVLPVDTHVYRVSRRLGLIGNVSLKIAHEQLQKMVPPERIYSFHINMVALGRMVCKAGKPECLRCSLNMECSYFAENVRPGR